MPVDAHKWRLIQEAPCPHPAGAHRTAPPTLLHPCLRLALAGPVPPPTPSPLCWNCSLRPQRAAHHSLVPYSLTSPPPGTDASVDRGPGPLGRNSLWWGRCDALDVPRAEGSFWPVRGARRVFMERTDGISRLSIISLHFFILGPILKLPIPLKRQGGNFSLMSFC